MPADFVGLSYEVQQPADPRFFAASNIGLIRQFKALALRPVLRKPVAYLCSMRRNVRLMRG